MLVCLSSGFSFPSRHGGLDHSFPFVFRHRYRPSFSVCGLGLGYQLGYQLGFAHQLACGLDLAHPLVYHHVFLGHVSRVYHSL
jgi:hypothetical protein